MNWNAASTRFLQGYLPPPRHAGPMHSAREINASTTSSGTAPCIRDRGSPAKKSSDAGSSSRAHSQLLNPPAAGSNNSSPGRRDSIESNSPGQTPPTLRRAIITSPPSREQPQSPLPSPTKPPRRRPQLPPTGSTRPASLDARIVPRSPRLDKSGLSGSSVSNRNSVSQLFGSSNSDSGTYNGTAVAATLPERALFDNLQHPTSHETVRDGRELARGQQPERITGPVRSGREDRRGHVRRTAMSPPEKRRDRDRDRDRPHGHGSHPLRTASSASTRNRNNSGSGSSIIIAPPPRAAINTGSSSSSPSPAAAGAAEEAAQSHDAGATTKTPSSAKDAAGSSGAPAAASLTALLREKDEKLLELSRELTLMGDEFARELAKHSQNESETATFWQAKYSALHQQYLRTDTELRLLQNEAEAREAEREEFRDRLDGLRRELLERDEEMRRLRAQVRGLKEFVSTSTRTDGDARTSDEVFGEGMGRLGNGLQNWVIMNFRRAKLGKMPPTLFLLSG